MVSKILGFIFGGIGAVALLITLFFVISNVLFISQAATADGIVSVVQPAGTGSSRDRAVISFTTSDGRAVQFTSQVGSNPPEFILGQKVRVYYKLDDPAGSARPDSFLSLWFWPLLAGIFAVIFGGVGLVFLSIYLFNQRKINWLRRNGQRVVGLVTKIQPNKAVRNQGKTAHIVWVQWRDPQNGQTHNFKSDNLWLDPVPFLPGSEINVLIDPQNMGRYYVDTSALPVTDKL